MQKLSHGCKRRLTAPAERVKVPLLGSVGSRLVRTTVVCIFPGVGGSSC